MENINPGTVFKVDEYTVTIRAESKYKLGRNDTVDFLNHLSILLEKNRGQWEDEADAWAEIIYQHLKSLGIYDEIRKTEEQK